MENYYLVLELPVERFVSDPAVIAGALDKKQREWNSSNNTQVKAKITQYITSGVIKQASEDAAAWKKVYDEAKEIVENDLGNRLSIVAASLGGEVSRKDIESMISKYKYKKSVTCEYAEGITARLGIAMSGSSPAQAEEQPAERKVTLKDYEPESNNRFSAPAKQLQIVGCADYYEFLRKYTRQASLSSAGTAFSRHTDSRQCAAAAREIEKAWSGKKEDSEKSAVDKVCDQIARFDSGDPASSQENYNKYLVWRSIKDIFAEFWSAMSLVEESKRAIDGKVKADMVSRLTEVVSDRHAAEQLLEEYCSEKKVALPKPLPNVGVCPFCDNPFDKNGGTPESCPSCRRSFILSCPKCGRRVNYAEKRECCGFNFDIYPGVERLCADAEGFAQSLDFAYADSLLADADRMWKGFPKIAEVRSLIESKKRLAESLRRELDSALAENRIYAAKTEYESLKKKLSGFSDPALESRIASSIAEAERLYELYEKETNAPKKLKLLVQISAAAADFPDIDRLIGSMPLSAVTRVRAAAEQSSGNIGVKWDCANEAGTAEYVVLRKQFDPPISCDDSGAEVVARTYERAFSDSTAEVGGVYYYAVYAARAGRKTKLCACREPAVLFPQITAPLLACGDTSIEASWSGSQGKTVCEVFRCIDPDEKEYGKGLHVVEVFDGGFRDTGLTVGEKYRYNIFFTIEADGESFVSQPVCCEGTTVKKSTPPEIEVTPAGDGAYDIMVTSETEEDCQLMFFLAPNRSLAKGSSVPAGQLTGHLGLRRLNAEGNGSGGYSIRLQKNDSGYLYAFGVRNMMAVTGGSAFVENLPMIGVKLMRNDGTSLHIQLEEFPKNADLLFVTYAFDDYPSAINGGTKLKINRSNYERENIVIKSLEERDHYITGFVRNGGEERIVFRALYKNGGKRELVYHFAYNPLTGLKLNVRFAEESPLPELSVRFMMGAVPVNESLGNELCTVPADSSKSKSFSVNLSKLTDIKPADNMYARVFVKDPAQKSRYIPMLAEGRSPKLKGR